MTSTLVLGSAGSGSTRHAESLLRRHPKVTCLTPRTRPLPPGIAEFRQRVGSEPGERPSGWSEHPTGNLSMSLLAARHPVLLDSVADWLWSVVDDHELWDDPRAATLLLEPMLDEAVVALRALPYDVVLVSEEAPVAGVADDPADLLLATLLGHANRRLSAACDQVHLVLGGRVLDLSGSSPVGAG
ncbi:bifunctional adenosylcobinamide kinase/adenosylcobinamide-phosphate guanylyltransferase [Serinicoccus kebangsaanensis]|uniref:bifunctional adenosylcobinamide kinase/adenosylcobinamide-phosphate guanylyltransferase n=1 Tax=Serinicoccus kebangsaanensis TaxID=2602069 RepID=UPI00124BE6C3|nr:bifunctional adenosylcobinamide kinase/adenosylcobinamide-phosphate guanylyltransferase [Serinicoccus kebangsaanensis]